jgi:hypothetical protein
MEHHSITVIVEGGLIQDVQNIPPGVSVTVKDYDVPDDAGDRPFTESEYGGSREPPQLDAECGRLDADVAELVECLSYVIEQTVDQDLKYGIGLTEGEKDARQQALALIARHRP